MSPFTQSIADNFLPSAGLCRSALTWFSRTGGRSDSDAANELSSLMEYGHSSLIIDPGKAPVLFYVGAKSQAAAVFGAEWARTATGVAGIPDRKAEDALNAAYFECHADLAPKLHICGAQFTIGPTQTYTTRYFRTLLPITHNRHRIILCVADDIPPSN